jgi:hypothetical protein
MNKKTFTSLWNILNESNYNKICHRLKFLVNKENVGTVVKEVMNMSVTHSIYRKYFILILKDVLKTYEGDNAVVYFKTIIDSYDKQYYIYSGNHKNDYDLFCDKLKHKTRILNTVHFILDIMNILPFTCEDYIDTLHDIFKETITQDDEYHVDLFLNIMIAIYTQYPGSIKNTYDWMSLTGKSESKKMKFLTERLVSITTSSSA